MLVRKRKALQLQGFLHYSFEFELFIGLNFHFSGLRIHFVFMGNPVVLVFSFIAIVPFVPAKGVVYLLRDSLGFLYLILAVLCIGNNSQCKGEHQEK